MKALLYEGKAKRVYSCSEEGLCVMEYKNSATAFNGEKKAEFNQKGELNCLITAIIFSYLAQHGISTHFVRNLSSTEALVKRVQIIPLEVIVRNYSAGSFSKRFGVEEGIKLAQPSVEFSYKNDELGDPMINQSQALALELAEPQQIQSIIKQAQRVNELLVPYFLRAGLTLVDFKLEFGVCNGEVILADEITPDTCRLWDVSTNQKLDKDRFRRDLGGVMDAYKEVYNRLLGLENDK